MHTLSLPPLPSAKPEMPMKMSAPADARSGLSNSSHAAFSTPQSNWSVPGPVTVTSGHGAASVSQPAKDAGRVPGQSVTLDGRR